MPANVFNSKRWESPLMMYLAPQVKAQDRTLSSSGSFLITGLIFLSGCSSATSMMPAINSSQEVLRSFMREKNFGRLRTSLSSSRRRGVTQRVKEPFSIKLNKSLGAPCQKRAEISVLVSRTIFNYFSFLYDKPGPLFLSLSWACAFLLLFQLSLKVLGD